jgi:putative ABC transport system substrate-binding protein
MLRTRIQWLILWWGLLGWCMAQAAEVVIVSSDRSPGYMEAVQTVVTEMARATDKLESQVLYLPDAPVPEASALATAKVIITLGIDALSKVLAREVRVPVVAALIPKAGFERVVRDLGRKLVGPVSALYLEQPFPRQVELLRLALPEARKVGVLWGSESGVQAQAVQSALQARGLELVNGYVSGGNTLFAGLKAVLDDTDVLLAVPDPQVYNGSSISNVLLATYRARVPMLAFSPAYVRAGALLSLHSTPRQIGLQATAMTRAQLQVGAAVGSQYPADFSIVLNDHVARSLGLTLDEAVLTERLRKWERRP